MTDLDVELFDVVPWTHGYAHSWALRWMLEHRQVARDAILTLFVPDGQAPWSIGPGRIKREARVAGQRADLRVPATDGSGRESDVIVETKVNDRLREEQIQAYCSEPGARVALYGPGLTGLLHSGCDRIASEVWVTGRQLATALSDLELPDLIRSYVSAVSAQADRMDAARAAARGQNDDFDREDDISEVSAGEVEAVAWVAETAAVMRARGAKWVHTRNTAHDYGIFWGESWVPVAGAKKTAIFIEVVAGHGGHGYVITIKAGEGTAKDRQNAFDAAMRAGEPWDGWKKGKSPGKATHFRLWTLTAIEMTAGEAADAAMRAMPYVESLGGS